MGSLVTELRCALHHLYDPHALIHSTLWHTLGTPPTHDPLALQDLLIRAIAALRPRPGTPAHSPSWRSYRVLHHRYVEQFAQAEVARALGISTRQLLRWERTALQALAAYLVAQHTPTQPEQYATAKDVPSTGEGQISREQEIAWLHESQPIEAVDVQDLVTSVLQTAAPVLGALGVHTQCALSAGLPALSSRYAPLRQALLHLLLALARSVPGGVVHLEARPDGQQIVFELRPVSAPDSSARPQQNAEALVVAGQLLAVAGGALAATPAAGAVAFTVPAVGRYTILFVDDNADALLLFERWLAGTRYCFRGTRDPVQAQSLAVELRPAAIVLDVMLSGMDGWELLGRLRAHPTTSSVPIIVCTILSDEQLALALGAAAFLRKPLKREALLKELEAQVKPE